MDDRNKEEEDTVDKPPNHRSKVHYYSQPLPQPPNSSAKRNAVRKHSLDDVLSTADTDNAGSGRSLSYPHYNSHLPPHLLPRNPSSDGTLTLERAMSEFGGAPGTLPEFVGAGGGSGIFRVPLRAAMHPNRPPALELRPHPLRETQYGAFLRMVVSTGDQLWAGQESGLRFWCLGEEVFEGCAGKKGDEESAVFKESGKGRMSPVLCMVVDGATGVIWSGHKDGKIRSWRIGGEGEEDGGGDEEGKDGGGCFKERLSWQAHRHPVLSMVISSYGKMLNMHFLDVSDMSNMLFLVAKKVKKTFFFSKF